MKVYLGRVTRTKPDGMGGDITYYNNLYATYGVVENRTEDGLYAIYDWAAVEIDPTTSAGEGDEPMTKTYGPSTVIQEGPSTGELLGRIDDNINFFGGVIAKVNLIVPVGPGSEIIPE